jgi:N-acyl homoserine lactone hydrolase
MRVHALQTGTVAIKQRQRAGKGPGAVRVALTLADRCFTEPLPILAWLVEHPEGLILVDTGETARATQPGYFPAWNLYFRLGVRERVTPDEEVGPRLEALGFSPSDVRQVVMTHLHTDHAGGLHHFPNSEILVARTELGLATGRLGKVLGYLPHRWPPWLKPRAVEFDGGRSDPSSGATRLPTASRWCRRPGTRRGISRWRFAPETASCCWPATRPTPRTSCLPESPTA